MAEKSLPQKVKDYCGGDCLAAPAFSPIDDAAEYLNLLANAIDITDGGESINAKTQRRIKSLLLKDGAAAYEPVTKMWFAGAPAGGVDGDGDPLRIRLTAANGRTFARRPIWGKDEPTAGGAYLFRALPLGGITFADMVGQAVAFMHLCDVGAAQNLEAVKTPYIVTCKNPEIALSIKQAVQGKQGGQAALIVSDELGEAIKGLSIEVPYLADKFEEFRDHKRAELLTKMGVLTANTEKRERVQSAEVNAKIGEATDYIYMMIDYFNKQAESYGLPFEMHYNGSMEELYTDDVDDIEEDAQAGAQNDD